MDSVPKEMFQSMYAGQAPWDIGKPQPGIPGRRRPDHWLGPGCRLRHRRSRPVFRQPGLPGDGHRFRRRSDHQGEEEGRRAKPAGDLPGQGRPGIEELGRAIRQRDRLGAVPRFLRPGPATLRRRTGGGLEAGWQGLPDVLQRRGTRDARAEAGVESRNCTMRFAKGWVIESIEPSRFEVIPDLKDMQFSEGGPKAWFAVIRRAG